MKNQVIIRVGEKNNFNMTTSELQELKKYEGKGEIFVNSNSFQAIDSTYPSFITINPYMRFNALRGDLWNVKAVRIKIFQTDLPEYIAEQEECIKFCVEKNLPILLTFMRYWKIETATKFSGESFRQWYEYGKGYLRPTDETKKDLIAFVTDEVLRLHGNPVIVNVCDSSGHGCPSCMNCTKLSYGIKTAEIKALNLSMSGKLDRYGRKGECIFDCPDCFAKRACLGKRPQCDKLITNKKIIGEI